MTDRFTLTITDEYYRDWRATYERKGKGQFAKLVKLERYQDNGKDRFWTRYRASVHGSISNALQAELDRAARMARVA